MSTPEMRLTLENVFGTIGTILWCIQLLPQIYMNYKRKTTFGLTPYLYIGWILSGLLLGIYTVVQNSKNKDQLFIHDLYLSIRTLPCSPGVAQQPGMSAGSIVPPWFI
jgi:uncharacterized protein with PQ loop repeat